MHTHRAGRKLVNVRKRYRIIEQTRGGPGCELIGEFRTKVSAVNRRSHMIALPFLVAGMSGIFAFVAFAQSPVTVGPGDRQLFLDDRAVQKMSGLKRTMHQLEKRGAVIKPDVPSDGCRVQTYSTSPMWVPEEGVYKMVYMAFPMENHNEIGAAYAVSKDGVHWEKPNLGQDVKVRGSTKNNRIFVALHFCGTHGRDSWRSLRNK